MANIPPSLYVKEREAPWPKLRSRQPGQTISVLFDRDPGADGEQDAAPDFFADLNLDQVVAAITQSRESYRPAPFLHVMLSTPDAIVYRQEVMRDVQLLPVRKAVNDFAAALVEVRARLARAGRRGYRRQQQRWFVDAASLYVSELESFTDAIRTASAKSSGLGRVRDYCIELVAAPEFGALREEVTSLVRRLNEVHVSMHILDGGVRVSKYAGASDYSAEVLSHFERFRQGAVELEKTKERDYDELNHVEAAILDRIALLYPELFADVDRFTQQHEAFIDDVVARFDREIQFYVGYAELIERLSPAGLDFCFPQIDRKDKAVRSEASFDLALASKLVADGKAVVTNDFYLEGAERIFVISGPNQGGKTTFARTFGQLHYLAALGLPVPGRTAKLYLFDRLFTHFEREEDIRNHRGKLQDDLVRIHKILEHATSDSIIVMNEIFTSTALKDALFLSRHVLQRIMALDALAVCVTFIDELTTLGPQTVSALSTVVPDNPAERTFKIERRKADGRAYAAALARKYRLTQDDLEERLVS